MPRCRERCAPCCRSGSSATRRSCCRPCRRWSPGPKSTRPPGTTSPCGLRKALRRSSTTPGCTVTSRACGVERDDLVEVLGVVDDQRRAHSLATLGGAGAARQDRHAFRDSDLQRNACRLRTARHDHAHRLHLVNGSVGAVAPAREGIEQHFAVDFLEQALLEGGGGARCGAGMELNSYSRGVHGLDLRTFFSMPWIILP